LSAGSLGRRRRPAAGLGPAGGRVGALAAAAALLMIAAAVVVAVILTSFAIQNRPVAEDALKSQLLEASAPPDTSGSAELFRSLDKTSQELSQRLRSAPLFRDLQLLHGDPVALAEGSPAAAGPVQDPSGGLPNRTVLETPRWTVFELRVVLTGSLERIERAQAEVVRRNAASQDLQAQLLSLEAARPTAWPVGGSVTDRYGWRILNGVRDFHTGIDIAAPMGTRIRAPKAGRVVWVGWRRGLGGTVEIEHEQGFSTVYAHLSYYATEVGRRVEEGEVVGFVGSTGFSTGPHLHYEIRRFGVPVNPDDYLSR
jgi:murein DD-endopeptidase MepM/ murein hydrolase activator NlpD